MVAVDPVDKNRNVAAALTLQKMSEFVVASGNFLNNQTVEYFRLKNIETDSQSLKKQFKNRGTKTVLVCFRPPEIPADGVIIFKN